MLSKEIIFSDVDVDKFKICMLPELNALNAKRFSYNMITKDGNVIFNIKASDDVAMKAAKSSIDKLHTVFKKMEGIQND